MIRHIHVNQRSKKQRRLPSIITDIDPRMYNIVRNREPIGWKQDPLELYVRYAQSARDIADQLSRAQQSPRFDNASAVRSSLEYVHRELDETTQQQYDDGEDDQEEHLARPAIGLPGAPMSLSLDTAIEDALRDNDAEVLRGTVRQFKDPYVYLRELVQNSLDAGATRVVTDVRRDELTGYGVISVADDGKGMDEETVRQHFLTLYSSSKELDRSTIGRFGVGLVSIFAQKPLGVLVETSRDGADPLRLFIGAQDRDAPTKIVRRQEREIRIDDETATQHGTRLSLYVDLNDSDLEETSQRLREQLERYCTYVVPPLTFRGELINKEFDVDSPIKTRFGGKGLEVVMGLARDTSSFKLMNHRLVITDGKEPFTEKTAGLDVLINSRFIDYTISRDEVLKNNKYRQIKKRVDKAVLQLVREGFSYLENRAYDLTRQFTPSTPEDTQVWQWCLRYLHTALGGPATSGSKRLFGLISPMSAHIRRVERSLDAEVLDTPLLRTVRDEPVSLRTVLRSLHKQPKIYTGNPGHLANEAMTAGLLVLKACYVSSWKLEDEKDNVLLKLLRYLGPVGVLSNEFHASQEISQDALPEEQRAFVREIADLLEASPGLRRFIYSVGIGSFRPPEEGRFTGHKAEPVPYVLKGSSNLSTGEVGYGLRSLPGQERTLMSRLSEQVYRAWHAPVDLLLNPDHSHIRWVLNATGAERTERVHGLLFSLAAERGATTPAHLRRILQEIETSYRKTAQRTVSA